MHVRAVTAAGIHELARVVAVRTTDYDDDVRPARQLDRGVLPLLRRPADRIDEAYVGAWKSPPDERGHVPHAIDRLRRLRRNADAGTLLECEHVLLGEHDV